MITKNFEIKNPYDEGEPVCEYSALSSLDEFKEVTKDATFIGAVDINGKGKDIVFGLETLRAVAAEVITPQRGSFPVFALDFNTDRVEHLLAAVAVTKGYHNWNGETCTLEEPASLG